MHDAMVAKLDSMRVALCKPGQVPLHDVMLAAELCYGSKCNQTRVLFVLMPIASGRCNRIKPGFTFGRLGVLRSDRDIHPGCGYLGIDLKRQYADRVNQTLEVPLRFSSDGGVSVCLSEHELFAEMLRTDMSKSCHLAYLQHIDFVRIKHKPGPMLDEYTTTGVVVVDTQIVSVSSTAAAKPLRWLQGLFKAAAGSDRDRRTQQMLHSDELEGLIGGEENDLGMLLDVLSERRVPQDLEEFMPDSDDEGEPLAIIGSS